MTLPPRRFVLAALLALAGCAKSPPTALLTLDAVPPTAPADASYRGRPIAVPAVHLPAELDRPEYVTHPAAGEAKVDDFAHWVAPLGLLARDTLVRDLAARLPQGAVLPPGASAKGARVIDVTILSFAHGQGMATMQAAYRDVPLGPVWQVDLQVPMPAETPQAGAQAFGALLGQLADRIAAPDLVR